MCEKGGEPGVSLTPPPPPISPVTNKLYSYCGRKAPPNRSLVMRVSNPQPCDDVIKAAPKEIDGRAAAPFSAEVLLIVVAG